MVQPAHYYPILGMIYLTQNIQHLGPRLLRSLGTSLATALAIIVPVLGLTFHFQRRIVSSILHTLLPASLAKLSLPGLSFISLSTLILATAEGSLLVALFMGEVLKKEKSKGLFRDVLSRRHVPVGPMAIVLADGSVKVSSDASLQEKEARIQEALAATTAQGSSSVASRKKFSFRTVAATSATHVGKRIGLWLVTLPLTFIPVLGPLGFIFINGNERREDIHKPYFDLKVMTQKERDDWIKARESEYSLFGYVAQGLELVPFIGILFGFTNTIGAALWAADLEKQQNALREQASLTEGSGPVSGKKFDLPL